MLVKKNMNIFINVCLLINQVRNYHTYLYLLKGYSKYILIGKPTGNTAHEIPRKGCENMTEILNKTSAR